MNTATLESLFGRALSHHNWHPGGCDITFRHHGDVDRGGNTRQTVLIGYLVFRVNAIIRGVRKSNRILMRGNHKRASCMWSQHGGCLFDKGI